MSPTSAAKAGLPDFMCIGVQKAGTTWLYEMLSQNPSIWLPPIKEIHFFDRQGKKAVARQHAHAKLKKEIARFGGADSPEDLLRNPDADISEARRARLEKLHYKQQSAGEDFLTKAWYRRIFSDPARDGRVSGDITPAYFEMKKPALKKVQRMLPDVRLILIIREPLARDISQLKMDASRKKFSPKSDAHWTDFIDSQMRRRWRGNYDTQLPLWESLFSPEQLLVLPFGDIRHRPGETLATIERFIGATPFDGYHSLAEKVHVTKDELEIPEWVMTRLRERADPQINYLIEKFGQDFYERTR